jgi:hypothetical protein
MQIIPRGGVDKVVLLTFTEGIPPTSEIPAIIDA